MREQKTDILALLRALPKCNPVSIELQVKFAHRVNISPDSFAIFIQAALSSNGSLWSNN